MNRPAIFISALLLISAGAAAVYQVTRKNDAGPKDHVRNEFSFRIHAPMTVVSPLFGADAERAWAGEKWNPQFVYPAPAEDVEGAVFRISHGHGLHRMHATWVNTAFDLAGGHVEYVYFLPDVMVTRIDIHISAPDAQTTAVQVAYERTALHSWANEHVRAMGRDDAASGPEWQSSLETALKRAGKLD